LLKRGELELALNSPIENRTMGGRPIIPGMKMCSVSGGGSLASWGVVSHSAEAQFERYADWHKKYAEPLKGLGAKALWDAQLRTMVVLSGKKAFGVTVTVRDPAVSSKSDVKAYLKNTARLLSDKGLGRL